MILNTIILTIVPQIKTIPQSQNMKFNWQREKQSQKFSFLHIHFCIYNSKIDMYPKNHSIFGRL